MRSLNYWGLQKCCSFEGLETFLLFFQCSRDSFQSKRMQAFSRRYEDANYNIKVDLSTFDRFSVNMFGCVFFPLYTSTFCPSYIYMHSMLISLSWGNLIHLRKCGSTNLFFHFFLLLFIKSSAVFSFNANRKSFENTHHLCVCVYILWLSPFLRRVRRFYMAINIFSMHILMVLIGK